MFWNVVLVLISTMTVQVNNGGYDYVVTTDSPYTCVEVTVMSIDSLPIAAMLVDKVGVFKTENTTQLDVVSQGYADTVQLPQGAFVTVREVSFSNEN